MNRPLWMPDGSVRALVFLMVTFTVCVLAFGKNGVMVEALKLAFGIIIGFYYGSKHTESKNGEPK